MITFMKEGPPIGVGQGKDNGLPDVEIPATGRHPIAEAVHTRFRDIASKQINSSADDPSVLLNDEADLKGISARHTGNADIVSVVDPDSYRPLAIRKTNTSPENVPDNQRSITTIFGSYNDKDSNGNERYLPVEVSGSTHDDHGLLRDIVTVSMGEDSVSFDPEDEEKLTEDKRRFVRNAFGAVGIHFPEDPNNQ